MIPPLLIDIIKRFEGLRLKAYQCPSGIWTIGYGHTKGVKKGLVITAEEAEDILLVDATKCLFQVIRVSPVLLSTNECRLSAVVDFVFNLGIGTYRNSTFRREVDNENWDEASQECKRWVFSAGVKLQGLVLRRELEASLLSNTNIRYDN